MYEGDFENDLYSGEGKEVKNGIQYNGKYSLGSLNGQGKIIFKDGSVVEGKF